MGFIDFAAAFFWGAERTTHPTWQLGFEGSFFGHFLCFNEKSYEKTQKRGLGVLGRSWFFLQTFGKFQVPASSWIPY